MSVCLFVIDPQVDFAEGGALPVTGATKDMERLAKMVQKHGDKIDDIQITLDSHYYMHIAHPAYWMDKAGNPPKPFTLITIDDVEKGTWRPKNPDWKDWSLDYVKKLKENNRFALCVWPPHCIIGTPGQCIHPTFLAAVSDWEKQYYAVAPRHTKGSNPFTEHYSAVKADVPHPKDPATRLNGRLIDTLKNFDDIITGGEALSHCLNFTVSDVADEFSSEQVKKFVLLEDAASSVGGFEKQGLEFIDRMVKKGMRVSTTDKFFK